MPRLSLLRVGLLQAALTAGTLLQAYQLHGQFFPTCVYLLKSSLSMTVLVLTVIYLMVLLVNLLRVVLFGPLRPIEIDHLHEYGWMTVSESFLAMTIFRNEFDSKFAVLFAGLILIKGFHWVSRDRVDYMEQAIRLPDGYHVKMVTTLYILAVTDLMGAIIAIADVVMRGPSMSIMMANEFCLMLVSLANTLTRYALNLNDIRRGAPWEKRSAALFYSAFAFDLTKLVIYTFYFTVIVSYYGLPIHIIRDLYMTFRSFVIRINDIVKYRQATADMENRYPTATNEELAASIDRLCIICREELSAEGDTPKKLPCGHIFHLRCLRSWLEQQQACPTCRKSVIKPAAPQNTGNAAQQFPGNQYPGNMAPGQRPGAPGAAQADNPIRGGVIYVPAENLERTEDGRLVLKGTIGTANPLYVERISESGSPVPSLSSSVSNASTINLTVVREESLETLDDQIEALTKVSQEIQVLMDKAQRIKGNIDRSTEDDSGKEKV